MARNRSSTIDSVEPLEQLLDQYSIPTTSAQLGTDDPTELKEELDQLYSDITAIAGIAKHYLSNHHELSKQSADQEASILKLEGQVKTLRKEITSISTENEKLKEREEFYTRSALETDTVTAQLQETVKVVNRKNEILEQELERVLAQQDDRQRRASMERVRRASIEVFGAATAEADTTLSVTTSEFNLERMSEIEDLAAAHAATIANLEKELSQAKDQIITEQLKIEELNDTIKDLKQKALKNETTIEAERELNSELQGKLRETEIQLTLSQHSAKTPKHGRVKIIGEDSESSNTESEEEEQTEASDFSLKSELGDRSLSITGPSPGQVLAEQIRMSASFAHQDAETQTDSIELREEDCQTEQPAWTDAQLQTDDIDPMENRVETASQCEIETQTIEVQVNPEVSETDAQTEANQSTEVVTQTEIDSNEASCQCAVEVTDATSQAIPEVVEVSGQTETEGLDAAIQCSAEITEATSQAVPEVSEASDQTETEGSDASVQCAAEIFEATSQTTPEVSDSSDMTDPIDLPEQPDPTPIDDDQPVASFQAVEVQTDDQSQLPARQIDSETRETQTHREEGGRAPLQVTPNLLVYDKGPSFFLDLQAHYDENAQFELQSQSDASTEEGRERRRRNRAMGRRKDPVEEYFILTCQAAKLNSPNMERICVLPVSNLYAQAIQEQIPFNRWHEWVAKELELLAAGN